VLLKETLFRPLFLVTIPHVRHFLATKEQQERTRAQERHLHKLRSLGLQATNELKESLNYCFYPHYHNFFKIEVEFEKAYSEIKTQLATKDILDLKFQMLNSHNCCISVFLKQSKHHVNESKVAGGT